MKGNTIGWIKNAAGKLNKLYALTIITSALQSVLMIVFALSVRTLINSAVSGGAELKEILKNAAVSLALVAGAYGVSACNKIVIEKCRITAETRLQKRLFSKILKKDYTEISSYKSGDLVNRMVNDSAIVARGYASVLPTLVSMVTRIVLAIGVLVALQPVFTLILASGGLLVIIASFGVRKVFKKLHKRTRAAESDVMSTLTENTSNVLAVKVFASEDKISGIAARSVDEYGKAAKKQRYITSSLQTAMGFCFAAFYLVTLIWGAIGLYRGVDGIDFGMITAMIQLVSQLQSPFANLTGLYSVYFEMTASAERLIELENLKDEPACSVKPNFTELYERTEKLCFEGVTFSYGAENVLEGADLVVKKGETLLITGVSGIGKSTLIKLLLGVYENYSGKIELELSGGERVKIDNSTRGMFAYVPQGNMLFSGTIRENVCFLNDGASEEEIIRATEIAAMDFLKDLPRGLDSEIGERGLGLSEGQSQRVAIARAVLSNRPVLLLDEATSALDEQTEKTILENLSRMANSTCIMVSHKSAAKSAADRTIRIVSGKIAEC